MSEPKKQNRWSALYEGITGASAPGGHHEEAPGTDAQSMKAGHEPDKFDAKGIIMVPIMVVVITTAVYLMVTGLFKIAEPGKTSAVQLAAANPQALQDGHKSYNERVSHISSSDDAAAVKQPRLEYMKTLDLKAADGTTLPPSYLSFRPADSNNTYEITPQDLYPDRYVDPKTGKHTLLESFAIGKDKDGHDVYRVPVEYAMHLLAGKLPTVKDGAVATSSLTKPKLANGGQAVAAPAAPAPAPKDDHGH